LILHKGSISVISCGFGVTLDSSKTGARGGPCRYTSSYHDSPGGEGSFGQLYIELTGKTRCHW